uniref:GDSL-type esterase/lipase family protein n=1 Tax=Agathobacter sp. TaxID=2021311 RepID=UPI004056CE39
MNEKTAMHWASIWGNAVSIGENRPESYGKNITLRYPIYSAFDGDAIRLTFDNYCGTDAICIEKTSILVNGVFYPVTFNGKLQAFIPAGEHAVSDEISCSIKAGYFFKVSFYLKDYTQMRSMVYTSGPLSGGMYATGDQTMLEEIPLHISRKTSYNYFLSNVSVYTKQENRAIVCFGDSITAQDWPDYLALRCKEEGFCNTSIIRRATSGSRILREYNCLTYESYGLKGEKRFSHEVPTDGADTVIIQQGINDIIHPVGTDVNPFRPMSDLPTAEELIEGLKTYISQAGSYGYNVYVGTLLPIEGWRTYAAFREELRNTYNNWIRSTDLIDGVIDFDKALCNPDNPSAFLPIYDSGDHLHPSAEGYKRMAEEVSQELLK